MSTNRLIAIIDDDASLCRSLSRLLREVGLQAISFASAEDFLASSERDRCACVIMDVQLPGMSGIELHRALVASGSRTSVIYVTAYDDAETRAEALSVGCERFFRKTDPGPDIIAAIRRALGSIDGQK